MTNRYAIKRAQQSADKYGSYKEGKLVSAENIAGRVIGEQLNGYRDRNFIMRKDGDE